MVLAALQQRDGRGQNRGQLQRQSNYLREDVGEEAFRIACLYFVLKETVQALEVPGLGARGVVGEYGEF